MAYERMSAQDAALFSAQDPATPLQIGAVARFDGLDLLSDGAGLDLARLRAHVERRLRPLTRFHQVLRPVAFDQGPPVWVDDPAFDVTHHVKVTSLPAPGSDRELRAFVARLLEEPLDDHRPLWAMWFVHGPLRPNGNIEGNDVVAVLKASHLLGDGIALLGVAGALLDLEPHPPSAAAALPVPRGPGPARPRPDPGPARLWLETALARGRHDTAVVARGVAGILRPMALAHEMSSLARGLAATVVPAPALTVTHPVGTRRDFAWSSLALPSLLAVADDQGVTLNDVVLSIVSAGLTAHLATASGVTGTSPLRGRGLRVLVPVSTHEPDEPDHLGNHFTFMIADLPAADVDPTWQLRQVHRATSRAKTSGQAGISAALFAASELVPVWLLRRAGPELVRRQPFVNLAVTNMAGSPAPLYLLGARLRELYPFITVTGNIGLIVGVVSYVDTLSLTLTVDADLVDDVEGLAAAMSAAADLLVDQVGVAP